MLDVFFKLRKFFVQGVVYAVDSDSGVARFFVAFDLLDVFALSSPDHRRHNYDFAFLAFKDFVAYNVNRLFFDDSAAFRTVRRAYARV